MESQQNNVSFLTTILKNRFIFGVIASVIVLTVGLFKTKKSSQSSIDDKNNNKSDKKTTKTTTSTSTPTPTQTPTNQEQDQFLKELQDEINKIKPLATSIDSENKKISTPIKSTINKNNIIVVQKKAKELVSLPHQILYQIFELISPQDFIVCSQLNKKWNTILNKLDKCWIQYSIDRWNLQQNYPFDNTKNNNKEFFKKRYLKERARLGFKPEQYIVTIMNECSEFTESGRWKSEKIINPTSGWWKKRFIEEMNKCLTMSTFLITNSNSNSNISSSSSKNNNIKKIKDNEEDEDDEDEDEDDEEDDEDDEEEKEGIENRCATGNIILNGKVNTTIGSFRFIDKEDALLKFKNEVWIDKHYTAEDSPYTGDVVGYFNFSLFPLDCDDELFQPYKPVICEFLRVLTFGTRGTVTRLKTNYSVNSIVFEQCPLSSIFGKYGFNDGDALLDTDLNSSYIVQLIEEIQNFLDKRGVGSNSIEGGAKVVYIDKTSHNPIRYNGQILSKEALQYELGIWIYNSVILQSKRLWNRRLED